MNVFPATVIVPLRAAPVLAVTLYVTRTLPVPEAPLAIVSHGTFDIAVHAHVGSLAVTANDPEPAAAESESVAGVMENVHVAGAGAGVGTGTTGGASAWEIVTACAAMVTTPLRAVPEFASMASATGPGALPAAPPIT